MRSSNPYRLTDKAIAILNKRAIKRFGDCKNRLSLLRFDELSVIKQIKLLYDALDEDNLKIFLELGRRRYKEINPERDEEEEITEFWLLDFLDSYNPVTKYQYTHETQRKRDYTAEAVNSSGAKAEELKNGLFKWSRFTAEYADIITDEVTLKAYRAAGVRRVKWNTEEDERVCEECRELDGKVFDIDKAPPKAHWRCRCWYTPAG